MGDFYLNLFFVKNQSFLKYKKGIFADQENKNRTSDGVHGGHKTLNDTKSIIYNLHHTHDFKKDSILIFD